jgi:DNA (cytosine-5)-methyltransferase 1
LSERPLLLDLFCGAGGAAMGYHHAGWDVVGVDLNPQPNFPFLFYQGDAIKFLETKARFWNFDAIHASPPCQHYLSLKAVNQKLGRKQEHLDLIPPTRQALRDSGLPYIIENVMGSPLMDPVRLCGTSFGLPIQRHRLFESNQQLAGTACRHQDFTERKYWTSFRPNGEHLKSRFVQVYGIGSGGKHHWPDAMGIDWMTYYEMTQAIPPAYTEYLGAQLLQALELTV